MARFFLFGSKKDDIEKQITDQINTRILNKQKIQLDQQDDNLAQQIKEILNNSQKLELENQKLQQISLKAISQVQQLFQIVVHYDKIYQKIQKVLKDADQDGNSNTKRIQSLSKQKIDNLLLEVQQIKKLYEDIDNKIGAQAIENVIQNIQNKKTSTQYQRNVQAEQEVQVPQINTLQPDLKTSNEEQKIQKQISTEEQEITTDKKHNQKEGSVSFDDTFSKNTPQKKEEILKHDIQPILNPKVNLSKKENKDEIVKRDIHSIQNPNVNLSNDFEKYMNQKSQSSNPIFQNKFFDQSLATDIKNSRQFYEQLKKKQLNKDEPNIV